MPATTKSILYAITAAGLWAYGFIATVWLETRLDANVLALSRFLLAAVWLVPLSLRVQSRREIWGYLRLGFVPGLLFGLTLWLQTEGLRFTTATKSGFITTLYVVMMPLVEGVLNRRRPRLIILFAVALSFVGTLMIVNVELGQFNRGDLLTLGCAIIATFQIFWVGRVSRVVTSPFTFNLVQSMWAALAVCPLATDAGSWAELRHFFAWSPREQLALLGLGFGSTVLAFGLQIKAQRVLRPTQSGLLFLLESPFAMFLAFIFLGEHLGVLQGLGAAVIMVAAAIACAASSKLP